MAEGKDKSMSEFKGTLVPDYPIEVINLKRDTVKELRDLYKEKKLENLIDLASNAVQQLPKEPVGQGDRDISEIYLLLATAIWQTKKDKQAVAPLAKKAAHFERTSKGAMWLIRDLNNEYSEETRYFLLEAGGEYVAPTTEGIRNLPFKTIYTVVAENEKEAFELAKDYDRPEITDKIELLGWKDQGPAKDLPKGVYSTMNLVVAQKNDSEKE